MKTFAYLVLGSTLGLVACTEPVAVTVTELGTNVPPLGWGFVAVDVSDTGHIVGNYGELAGAQVAVFEDTGEAVLLPIPAGYSSCHAVAVANGGRIAGYCNLGAAGDGYRPRPFFTESVTAPFQFIPLGEGNHRPWDMNDNGVMLGSTNATSGTTHWTYDTLSGEHTLLPELPNFRVSANAINDAGDVAGMTRMTPSDGPSLDHAVQWPNGTLVPALLPSPLGNVSSVAGINNRGGIVGVGGGPLLSGTAVFWPSANAPPEVLPFPPAPAGHSVWRTLAFAVNEDGYIAGLAAIQPASSSQGGLMGIVWTPDRRIIELGKDVFAEAINASGVIVGRQGTKPVRIELELTAP